MAGAFKFYLVLFFTIIAALIAQLLWVQYIPLWGIGPQIVLVFVIYCSLHYGALFGETMGFVCGILLDTFSVSVFGTQAFMMALAGYLFGSLSRRIDEGSPSVQFLVSLFAVCLQVGIVYLVSVIFVYYSTVNYKDILVAPLYTAVLSPAIFKIMDFWMGIVSEWSGKKKAS